MFGRNHISAIVLKDEIEHVHMLFGRSFGRLKRAILEKFDAWLAKLHKQPCFAQANKDYTEFVFINCSTFSYWH